jgi:F0F1-type ATP synthase assembly protein I
MNDKEKSNNKSPWWREGLISFMRVSACIAIPIIIAFYLGKYLDDKYNTKPWIFLGLTFIAFIVSLISIYINMMKYIKEIEKKD